MIGEARSSIGGVGRIELQRDFPAVIDAESAKALAHEQLARAWAERERLTVRLPTRHLAVQPGACVTLPLNPERWLVERTALEGFCCVIELRPFWMAPASELPADSGRLFERAPEVAGDLSDVVERVLSGAEDPVPAVSAPWARAMGWSRW